MSWLVTGGAGYIGAHVVRALAAANLSPVVIDDLSSGHAGFVPEGVPLVRGTILDRALVEQTLRDHDVDGVIHVAGYKYAGVSVQRPLHTYAQNVEGTRVVLEAMQAADVANVVFSSSAAVYGTPDVPLVTEDLPKRPASPYGESKLIGEWLLRDQATATAESEHPLRHTSLRYFNVVGSGDPSVYDTSPHNLFPLVFEALIEGRTPRINGDDYDTRTARTCATTCTSPTSRRRTSWRHSDSQRAIRSSPPTTSARRTGSRSGRSWTRWRA